MDMNRENTEEKIPNVDKVNEALNIDEIFANDPEGYAAKFTPEGRKMIINYLNSRPMVQVEPFFSSIFDIEDQDPFITIPWIKRLFDYLKNVCPRGEAKGVVIGLASHTILFKKKSKEEVEASQEKINKVEADEIIEKK